MLPTFVLELNESLASQSATLKALEADKKEITETKKILEDSSAAQKEYETKIQDLEKSIGVIKEECSGIKNKCSDLENEKSQLQSKIDKVEMELSEETKIKEKLETSYDETMKDLKTSKQAALDFESQLQKATADNETFERQLGEANKEISGMYGNLHFDSH